MSAQIDFDATSVEPMQPLGALPKGRYEFVIQETEMKDAKSGAGQYLLVTSEVSGGEFAGRKFFDRFNLVHANKQAEDIGRRQLAALCAVLGIEKIGNSDELHGHVFEADVKVQTNEKGESNQVTGYYPAKVFKNEPAKAVAPAPAAKPAAPWNKPRAA